MRSKINRFLLLFQSGRFGSSLLTVALLTTIGAAIPVGYNIGVINSPANVSISDTTLLFRILIKSVRNLGPAPFISYN